MKTYLTSEVAAIIGIHPNTVRLYEDVKLIPAPKRRANGYRIFTEFHIEQLRLVRLALQVEVLQNGLRRQAMDIVKTSAAGDLAEAKAMTMAYIEKIQTEHKYAEEAIESVSRILTGSRETDHLLLKRKEAAAYLQISMDTLRNWEMNGLLTVKRSQNGYRIYMDEDLKRLKIIRSLRCANYSLSAILRMLGDLSHNPGTDIRHAIDTPGEEEDIITVCDKLLTALNHAESNARLMVNQLNKMEQLF